MKTIPVDILLVEDRAEDAELAIMALEDSNLVNNIHWVKDGLEALDFLLQKGKYEGDPKDFVRPRIVLLDIKMPKVDGIEVLRQIRSNERTKTMPVIIMTTSTEERDIIDSYKLGVNSYIVKPVGFDNFTKSIKDVGYYWLLVNEPPIDV